MLRSRLLGYVALLLLVDLRREIRHASGCFVQRVDYDAARDGALTFGCSSCRARHRRTGAAPDLPRVASRTSWEILAGVVALKTVARYSKLDEQHKAEYFLIGSLASILWAVVITAVIALYDRGWGFGVLPMFGELFGRKT